MQLKFKKICLLSTIIVYCASFLLQSNLALFETWAADSNVPRVNIVAVLVDDNIYGSISGGLQWYVTEYVQKQLSETKALVMPLDLSNISAYDIHRMMENIYFDGLENVNSSLIGLIMIGDIPLPVVNQDGYVFPTVYPYVDFEDQKYIRDPDSQYFVPNDNPGGQAEIWHGLVNYGRDPQSYLDFFKKVEKYVENPDEFIGDAIWYEDFIASKEGFLNENYPYYRNKIMFGEDLSYQRYSPLMKKMFFGESADNAVDVIGEFGGAIDAAGGDAGEIWDSIDSETIETLKNQGTVGMHTTKMIQQEIQDSFLADYDELFSNTSLSTMRENVLAGGRWIRTYENASGQAVLLANADSSSSMIQLKDSMYLGNDNLQGLLENLNELMEKMIDKKIEEEKYSMDIVIPVEYKEVTGKRIYFKCFPFVTRYENYYFGKNARLINNAQELSIYRGTYRNLSDINGVTYDSLLTGDNPAKSSLDKTDLKLRSIGSSYDIFSNQAEGNRGYYMLSAANDYNTYEENKTRKEDEEKHVRIRGLFKIRRKVWPEGCTGSKREEKKCEDLFEFAKRWWGGSSSINLNEDKVGEGRYELKGYDARDSRKTIYDAGGFQSLLTGEDEGMNGKGWTDGLGKGPQTAATSFKSYIKYSSPTEVEGWSRKKILGISFYSIYANHTPNVHMDFNKMNYWNLSTANVLLNPQWKWYKEGEKLFYTEKISGGRCVSSERYSYKTLSSVVKHDSTNAGEINGIDYDKYGDEGALGKNYHDIRVAYEDVNISLDRIIDALSGLTSDVESNNRTISNYISQLSGIALDLKKKNERGDQLDSEITRLGDEITSLQSSLSSVESEISDVKSDIEYYQNLTCTDEDEEGNSYSYDCPDNAKVSELESKLSNLEHQASDLSNSISDKQSEKDGDEAERSNIDGRDLPSLNKDVGKILSTVSEIITTENTNLSDIYSEIVGLFADNIIGIMEYIIYLEGGNPEDYEGDFVPANAPRVPFLSEWIMSIGNLSNTVKSNVNSLRIQYRNTYDLIVKQQGLWNDLKTILRNESVHRLGETQVSAKIDSVDTQMSNIFTIKSRDDDTSHMDDMSECKNNDCNTEYLQKTTADERVKEFVENLEFADKYFKNITKVDTGGTAIIQAALTDPDFRLWTAKKGINLSTMSGADIINQYARWAQTDGENTTGAKVNRELLAGASIHMSGMNVLTSDRPIDSPRYVSMQSIAGNDIKLIYPDLFKVEVFVLTGQDKSGYDIHELLTGGQIKENLVKYLTGKVEEYNKILETEYKKAEVSIGNKSVYYSKLKSLGFDLATPEKANRPYKYFTYEDFENALGGSGMLDAISEMLYYQSLTNKKKLSTGSVSEDIELIKKSFSLNDRREWVLKDYLTEWTGEDLKTTKNPLLVIPTYELSGYEVAYVNSDGKDYIIPKEVNVDTTSSAKADISKIRRHQPIQQEENFNDECNIPKNGKLPIFELKGGKATSPWYEGFKCWWKHTLEEPFKIELTFDRSLGEVLVGSGFKEFMKSIGKSYLSETKEEFTARGDQMTKYADDRESLLSPGTGYDADKDITQMQVEAEKHNAEVNAGGSNASTIARNIKISNSNALLSDSNPSSLLRIEPISDVGSIQVVFMGTGDGCITVDGSTLCKGATTTRTFTKKKPFSGLVTADCVAGKDALDIKIYGGGGYYEKVLKYTVSPGVLDNFEIKVYDEKTVAGMASPVEVIGYDKCGNRVNWGLEKFDITTSQGEFLKDGAYLPEITTNDFRKLRFYYRAPLELQGDKAIIQISKHGDGNLKPVILKPNDPYEQPLVDGAPLVKLNGTEILRGKTNLVANETYRLSNDQDIYDASGKLRIGKLQRLDIEIEDLNGGGVVDVDNQVLVTSQNGLVYIGQVQKDEKGNEFFFETSKNYISGGKATVYYYPSTVAGEEIINIDIPGLETRVINLSIKPAGLAHRQLLLEKDVLYLKDTMNIELFLSDKWGNLIDSDKVVAIFYDQDKVEFIDPSGGVDGGIEVLARNGYGKYTVVGTGAGLAHFRVGNDFYYFNVDKHIFPDSGLNILYLNYFGNDRGNQWGYFSDNKGHVEDLMLKSNKIITTTTQLVSEDKIKKMVWKIEPGFKIWNPNKMSTILTINGSQFSMVVGDASSMKSNAGSLSWMQVTQDAVNEILNSNSKKGGNYAFFFPSDTKYSIDKNGVLFNSGNRVAGLADGDVGLQLSTSFTEYGDNVWNLIYKGVNYGNIVIHCPGFIPKVGNFDTPGERYLVNSTFTNGSTDKISSVGIFDLLTNFKLNTNYKSIQNSDELNEKIGFLGDFKNITLFAEGEIVGEATRKFGSEFVINLGDPVLSRKSLNENVYGTNYDGGIGQEIYADPENNIFGTYQIDFDGNGTKDLLVVYLDGSVKLSKNYGGMPDLRNMQELMRIAVPIKEVFVGDADGKGGEDIIILTKNDQLRAYLNNGGVFDVDGRVGCLNQNVFGGEISSTPSSLEGIYQIFVEDMNKDNKVDVITYDNKGYIKVFYGGSTSSGPNYLSKETYACDTGWYNREAGNTTIVDALGVSINGGKIFDNSMVHWIGMERPNIEITEDELESYGIHFDPNDLEKFITERDNKKDGSIDKVTREIMDINDPEKENYKFDLSEASNRFINDGANYVDVTLFENTLVGGSNGEGDNYLFVPSSYLDYRYGIGQASIWKNYRITKGGPILQDGDIVTVRVTVHASNFENFHGAIGDVIQGPWNLYYDENNVLKSIRFVYNKGDSVIKPKDGNFAYLIDNINLPAGGIMQFEYDLEYRSVPLRKMDITYETFYSDDDLPDIKLQSVDGCDKNFDAYINGGGSFGRQKIMLQDMINETYETGDKKTEDYTKDVIDAGSNVNQLPGIVGDKIDRVSLLGEVMDVSDDEEGKEKLGDEIKSKILQRIEEGGLEGLNMHLNVDLSIFEEQTDAIENIIDDITKGMCNGFEFGGTSNCKGLPVPFNQAFLAPGKYHLFGCWDLPLGKLEKGIPVFFFPGTLHTPVGDIPIPWGMKAESDEFLWVPGGNPAYASFIRIYAAPTLTAQLGLAICLGPSAVANKLKSPWADLGGNCIVFAVKPQCKNDGSVPTNLESPYESFTGFVEEVRDSGVCLESQKGFQITEFEELSTPFNLNSFNSSYKLKPADNYPVDYTLNADFGIINLERDAYIASDDGEVKNSIMIGDVDILGGDFTVNKIKGGLRQGLRKILIDNWLDPQIRYILNQLTKMHVDILWPDLSDLMGDDLSTIYDISLVSGVGMRENSTSFEDVKSYYSEFADSEGKVIANMRNGLGGVFDEYGKNAKTYKLINGEAWSGKTSSWDFISNESVSELNNKIGNPFEALASLMNESNIINVYTEPLTVKVPMIFSEDINEYQFYLNQWLEENQAIVKEWEDVLNAVKTNCSKKPVEEQAECRDRADEALGAFIEFEQGDRPNMINKIYTNLMILQEYRDFPFEIYEWMHVIDRYMSEIASLINNTVGYLSYWVVANSERFVGYIDAITLMLNIIKTYQLIIDFSVEWSQRCGNCAKDTYDQYSCKLSFLCNSIKLPIIQIPNFKLPNITIDLSSVDIGLDIILPEFNFQPVKISLPDIPNLPEPPSIGVSIKLFDLPDIPILPEPPTLPELPSFIPEVEIELPILPPAPELPELPNEIEGIIKVADAIGKIYCIVKKKFGLVGEGSVKAKIEQITQRTYEVKWIDNIMNFTNWSVAPLKNYGVDYEISSYVDLQFTMDDFYDYLDVLTRGINNLSETVVKMPTDQINKKAGEFSEALDGVNGMNLDIQLGMSSSQDSDLPGLTSDEIKYVDYGSAKKRLNEVLAYFKNELNSTTFVDSIGGDVAKIEKDVNRPNVVIGNTEGIDIMKTEIMNYLDSEKVYYDGLATLINENYDSFLAMVDSQDDTINNSQQDKLLTFNVQLFNLDSSTKETVESMSKINPYRSLIENKQEIIDGYWNAINTNTSESLGLTEREYLVLRDNIGSMKKQVSTLYSVMTPSLSTKLVAKDGNSIFNKSLVAEEGQGLRIGSNMKVAKVIDPSVFSDGIYEKMVEGEEAGKLTKVVNSESFVEDIGGNFYDTNHFGAHDIILRDENAVYKKCESQSCSNGGIHYGGFYMKNVKEIPYEETWLDFGGGTKLKIADGDVEVKNWKVTGQSYDILSFSWDLSEADAYLIKLVERIDYSYEKVDYNNGNKRVSYVLALPNGVEMSDLMDNKVKLELLKDKKKKDIDMIKDLYGKDLVQVVYYDSTKDKANIIISDVERKWYYGRISTLDLQDGTYYINSPWSNQIVAGKQAVGDDQPPLAQQQLFRPSTQEIVSEGDDLEGYVGTRYILNIIWRDNVALSYINVSQDGVILDEKYTSNKEDTLSVPIDLHFYNEMEMFDLLGIDQFGNTTEKTVSITFNIPTIQLTDVSKNPDGETIAITAELSQDIDQGNVSFQRRRGEAWKSMIRTGIDCADIPIGPEQTVIIGTPYSAGNNIAMYDKDESVIALLNPDTSEIKLQSGYEDKFDINVKVVNSAVLYVCNKQTKENKFSVSIPTDSCVKIEAEGYNVENLPEDGNMGMFNGGQVVHRDGNNILIASPTCHLYSEYGLEGTYSYDSERDAVLLELFEPSDVNRISPIKVWLKTKPFLPK